MAEEPSGAGSRRAAACGGGEQLSRRLQPAARNGSLASRVAAKRAATLDGSSGEQRLIAHAGGATSALLFSASRVHRRFCAAIDKVEKGEARWRRTVEEAKTS